MEQSNASYWVSGVALGLALAGSITGGLILGFEMLALGIGEGAIVDFRYPGAGFIVSGVLTFIVAVVSRPSPRSVLPAALIATGGVCMALIGRVDSDLASAFGGKDQLLWTLLGTLDISCVGWIGVVSTLPGIIQAYSLGGRRSFVLGVIVAASAGLGLFSLLIFIVMGD